MAQLSTNLETLFESVTFNTDSTTNNTIVSPEKSHEDSEKSTFNLIIKSIPNDKKIPVLKVVRTITGLGLKESKVIVDTVPQIVKENILHDEAVKFQTDLETAGATVLLEPVKK